MRFLKVVTPGAARGEITALELSAEIPVVVE